MHTGKRGSYYGCFKAFQNDLVEKEGIYERDNKNNFVSNNIISINTNFFSKNHNQC